MNFVDQQFASKSPDRILSNIQLPVLVACNLKSYGSDEF